ncbi:MAG TPA: hypothetical protein VL460_01145 [Caulobacteraceae bacterium]|jgi:hypothetical protein|nr:hypothetical protein [Caulobacteraceae bacterium]
MSVIELFDAALKRLAQRHMHPISIIADPADHDELAGMGEWPVTYSKLHLSFRGVPTFRAEKASEASIVGRATSGTTTRISFKELAD